MGADPAFISYDRGVFMRRRCYDDDDRASETNEAAGEGFQKELFHFVHPALDEDEGWKVHKEVERLVKRYDVQDICRRLNQLKKENKVMLPTSVTKAFNELERLGLPTEKGGFNYKTFSKYYNVN